MEIGDIVIKDRKKYIIRKVLKNEYIECEPFVKKGVYLLVDITYFLKKDEVKKIEHSK